MKIFSALRISRAVLKGLLFNMQLAITILQLICAVAVVLIVLFQSGKSAGLSGAIAGGADTFMSKNKGKSMDSRLAKLTKWVAVGFMILTLLLCLFL